MPTSDNIRARIPQADMPERRRRVLHILAVALAVGTVLLITKGGLVHSAGAGLSVPDWPTTYGDNMFTYPVSKWTGGIFYEHVHRLIGAFIGTLTIVVAVLVVAWDARRWMRRLALVSVAAVVTQGVLGGVTVLMQLPAAVSVSHALLAQVFMLMTMLMMSATSRRWMRGGAPAGVHVSSGLQHLLLATVVTAFLQIFLGALTRHTFSGPAITDFPLNNGRIIPAFTSFGVAIHFAHRVGALVLATCIVVQTVWIVRKPELHHVRPLATASLAAVFVQMLLGAVVIWTRLAVVPNTAHVAGGAITFAFVFLAYVSARRWYVFQDAPAPAPRMQEVHA